MDRTKLFLDKRCRITYLNGFVLEGIVRDIDNYGIVFETSQKTSFIAWQTIRDVQPLEGGF